MFSLAEFAEFYENSTPFGENPFTQLCLQCRNIKKLKRLLYDGNTWTYIQPSYSFLETAWTLATIRVAVKKEKRNVDVGSYFGGIMTLLLLIVT